MRKVILEAQPQHTRREVFLLATSRIRSLLLAASSLCDAGRHDGIPTLYRTLFESWLHGAFLLLAGDDGMKRLDDQLEFETARLDSVFGTTQARNPGTRLTVKELVDEIEPLATEEDPRLEGWVQRAYDTQFRTTSFHHVHGHLGGIALHISEDGAVALEQETQLAHHVLAMSISFSIGLTDRIAQAFGV